MSERQETVDDIIAEKRRRAEEIERDCAEKMKRGEMISDRYARELVADIRREADRLEAAHKRETDGIHRAMVILAGIEMHNPDDPPKLWTALDDAYNALSEALGTDGDVTADEEEAKATGRHFVIQPRGDCAKLREAAVTVYNVLEKLRPFSLKLGDVGSMREFSHFVCLARNRLDAALAAPPRNCDVGTAEEQSVRMAEFCRAQYKKTDGVRLCSGCRFFELAGTECPFAWAQLPYEEGGAK